MKEHRALLTGADAHRLADMTAKLLDLRMATAAAAQLKRHEGNPDMQFFEALATQALVRYARAHNQGVRNEFKIPQEEWVPADLKEAHQAFLDLRDKHIAHSVNDWDVSTPYAQVIEDDAGRLTVHAVAVENGWMVLSNPDSLDQLWHLAKTLADRLEKEIEAQRARVMESVKQLPQENLRKLIAEYQPAIPGQGKLNKRRSR
jgi:hypothetical protein